MTLKNGSGYLVEDEQLVTRGYDTVVPLLYSFHCSSMEWYPKNTTKYPAVYVIFGGFQVCQLLFLLLSTFIQHYSEHSSRHTVFHMFFVQAGLFCVFMRNQTLAWTTGSLMCVCDILAYVYTQGMSVYSLIHLAWDFVAPFLSAFWIS